MSLALIFWAWRSWRISERGVKIGDVAREYCETTCEAVKTVDPNHFILGGRSSGNKGILDRVLDSMKDRVDVLSVYSVSTSRVRSRGCVW
jgi:hypothetical protein